MNQRLRLIDGKWWRWLLTLAVPAGLFWYFNGIPIKMALYFFITLWAVLSWLLETLPEAVVGLALPVLFLMAGVGTPQQIFSPWVGEVPWIILAGLVFGSAMMETGLTKRIAYKMVLTMGSGYHRLMLGIFVTGMIIAPIVPSSMGKAAILAVLVVSLCQAMGYEPRSREATALMLTALFSIRYPGYGYLTGVAYIPMAMDLTASVAGFRLYWAEYLLHNLLPWSLFGLLSVGLIMLVLRSRRETIPLNAIADHYREMGPMSWQEKKMVVISVVLLAFLATDFLHKIPISLIFMLGAILLFVPGIELMDQKQLRGINFAILFFTTGSMSIGVAANVTGTAKWAATALAPMMQGSLNEILLLVFGAGVISRFCMHTTGAIAAFTVPLAMAAQSQGLNPYPVVYSFLFSMEQPVFPFQLTTFLYIFSFGYMSLRELLKVTVLKVFFAAVFLILFVQPYWRFVLDIF